MDLNDSKYSVNVVSFSYLRYNSTYYIIIYLCVMQTNVSAAAGICLFIVTIVQTAFFLLLIICFLDFLSSRVIWLGDLNYRISLSYRSAKALVEMQNWRALLENDQV